MFTIERVLKPGKWKKEIIIVLVCGFQWVYFCSSKVLSPLLPGGGEGEGGAGISLMSIYQSMHPLSVLSLLRWI